MAVTPPLWRQIQRSNFTDWKKLISFLELDPATAASVVLPHSHFPLNLPHRLAEKIEKGTWQDPLLLQFLPTQEESKKDPLFVSDPVGDICAQVAPKLLHKYSGRALLLVTSACAMHCRYCFRRHFDYEIQEKGFERELTAITQDPSIEEVLLSGGDPLSLSDEQLGSLLEKLDQIPHVKRIRFHTRFPMGIPERIDAHFLKLLASCKKQIFFIIHCNHTREFDAEIFSRLREIQKLGIPVMTQTVLLRGINDDVETLKVLFTLLIDHGILPYYLHQLDRVEGATHFEVPEKEGKQLMKKLEALLPGYALPKYVKEIPHEHSKTLIF